MDTNNQIINYVRGFNRFYTNILGLLDRHILDSDFSLTEARILFELYEIGSCTANALSARLNVDKSYMSRIIAGFEKKGLITKTMSSEDNRANYIVLTGHGNQIINMLMKASDCQIEQLIAPLNDDERNDLYKAMQTIKGTFAKAAAGIRIRPFTDKDIGYIISRQIHLYKVEYGFDTDAWRTYVADGVHQLVNQFDPNKDIIYILEADNSVSGCIAVTHTEDDKDMAQLRFFFMEPALRGLGAGNKLINTALDFCKEKKYKRVFLWTVSDLVAARHLYSKYGFQMTETHENTEWGEAVLEERWDLEI